MNGSFMKSVLIIISMLLSLSALAARKQICIKNLSEDAIDVEITYFHVNRDIFFLQPQKSRCQPYETSLGTLIKVEVVGRNNPQTNCKVLLPTGEDINLSVLGGIFCELQ